MPDLLGEKDRTPPAGPAPGRAELAALRDAVVLANRAIIEEAGKDPARTGMGTTLTALLLRGSRHSSPISATAGPIVSAAERLPS